MTTIDIAAEDDIVYKVFYIIVHPEEELVQRLI